MKHYSTLLCLAIAAAYAQNTPQHADGLTVQVGGTTVGRQDTLNFVPGNGILHSCVDDGKRVNCTPSYNSALIATHDTVHANENYCYSTNGTVAYTCNLGPKALARYAAGMTFLLNVDSTCSNACTLNIDGIAIVALKKIDGTTEPGGMLIAGEPQWIFYDGKVFRLMGMVSNPLDQRRDVIARRFIGSMDTLTYAAAITLDTTAGDLHKIVTTNAAGNATISAATGGLAGQHMWVIVANDFGSPKTISFGANLRTSGPIAGAMGKAATIHFVSDGTAWYEVARTLNL